MFMVEHVYVITSPLSNVCNSCSGTNLRKLLQIDFLSPSLEMTVLLWVVGSRKR